MQDFVTFVAPLPIMWKRIINLFQTRNRNSRSLANPVRTFKALIERMPLETFNGIRDR